MFWRVWDNTLVTGLYGMGDLEYVLDEVYLYNSINDFLRALTENNAVPSGLLKYKSGRLDKKTLEDTQKQWDKILRTWRKAGKVKVMDQDFEFVPINLPLKDLEFSEGRKWLRGVIANAFGVPEDLLTTENSNRANSTTAITNYYRFTIKPKLKRIEERLNSHLISLYDDNLFFAFDECIPADEQLAQKKEVNDLQNGVITINEVRGKRGLPDVSWGSLPFVPAKETIRESVDGTGETGRPNAAGNNASALREDARLEERTEDERNDEHNPDEELPEK
jgi:HK97 family phage portal protein